MAEAVAGLTHPQPGSPSTTASATGPVTYRLQSSEFPVLSLVVDSVGKLSCCLTGYPLPRSGRFSGSCHNCSIKPEGPKPTPTLNLTCDCERADRTNLFSWLDLSMFSSMVVSPTRWRIQSVVDVEQGNSLTFSRSKTTSSTTTTGVWDASISGGISRTPARRRRLPQTRFWPSRSWFFQHVAVEWRRLGVFVHNPRVSIY